MLKKEIEQRNTVEMFCTDMLVPKDHMLRKIDAAVDFNYIYKIVEGLYCENNGRPSIDPVVLFKLVLIQHLYGIRSLRQTVKEADMNIAYRWFLGYTLAQAIPHFATISYAFVRRFNSLIVEKVFNWILNEANEAGYLSPEIVFVDGTHIKANANLKKHIKKQIPETAKKYEKQLMDEINEDREKHNKKAFEDEESQVKEKKIIESTTDQRVGYSTKENIKSVLHIQPIQYAIRIIS